MPTTIDYIEEYLNHSLSAAAQHNFEEKLKSDKDFARDVEEHAILANTFDETKAAELILGFKAIEKELEGGKERQFGFPVYLKWAAAVAVLAVASLVVYLNTTNSTKELFIAYYTPYPNVESPVSRSETGSDAVWQYYESGDYKSAYQLFEGALVANEADINTRFYLGICALELNKMKVAEDAFATVVADKSSNYAEQAAWYLALSYLKDSKGKKARQNLEEIVISKSSYSKKAKALLVELE